jgi:hypothetical protein
MASFDVNFVLYAVGDEGYFARFKDRLREAIDLGDILVTTHNLDLSPVSMGFSMDGCGYNPQKKGDVCEQFYPIISEFSDGSDEALCCFFAVEEYTTSGIMGYGCAYECYDLEGDYATSKHFFFEAVSVGEDLDTALEAKDNGNRSRHYI